MFAANSSAQTARGPAILVREKVITVEQAAKENGYEVIDENRAVKGQVILDLRTESTRAAAALHIYPKAVTLRLKISKSLPNAETSVDSHSIGKNTDRFGNLQHFLVVDRNSVMSLELTNSKTSVNAIFDGDKATLKVECSGLDIKTFTCKAH